MGNQKIFWKCIPKKFISHFVKGDISGAFTAATLTFPMAMAYGIITFSSLGIEFAPLAALAGVNAAIFAGFFASLFGGSPTQITGPMLPLTLILSTFVSSLVLNPMIEPSPTIIFGLVSLCVLISGFIQVLFGFLGLSDLVKYIPQPVVSGFVNGIALLVILDQIPKIFGVDSDISLFEIIMHPSIINRTAIVTGTITILSCYIAKRFLRHIPPIFFSLIVGTGSFYLLLFFFPESKDCQVIGSIQTNFPTPDVFFHIFRKISLVQIKSILPQLLFTSLIICLIGSMESMFSAAFSDNLSGFRHNSKKEIIGLGLGNIASSFFGSIASAGSILRSTANYKAGGRTRLSGMLCSVFTLLMMFLFGSLAGKIPLAVIAGILFVVGVNLIDKWSLNIAKNIFTSFNCPKEIRVDIFIIFFVAAATVSINLIAAVGVGMVVASLLFISKIGRSVIKRHYFANHFHSRKMRPTEHINLLEKKGSRISMLQLQGPIFFGSAENLADKVQQTSLHSDYVILDFKHVNEIDSTGSAILLRVARTLKKQKKYLLLANLQNNNSVWPFLVMINFSESLRNDYFSPDLDSALEWAEESLLNKEQVEQEPYPLFNIKTVSLFDYFTDEELEAVQQILIFQVYAKGENVFNINDNSRDLYILAKGLLTVRIYLPEKKMYKRLVTYSPGISFGEISFLDGSPRSAEVQAHEYSEVFCLRYADIELLCQKKTQIKNKLIKNIALEISRHLRRISDQVRELEEN